MELFRSLLLFFFYSLPFGVINGTNASNQHKTLYSFKLTKLFVFGDSYADTGNIKMPYYVSRKFPYGITYPGKPSGRFSDGRVATDFVAQTIGIKSPVPYEWKDSMGKEQLKFGMNFAYGGTGVFNTLAPFPNMTTQIDFFHNILTLQNVYSPSDLNSSVALVSVAGNDYSYYLGKGSSAEFLKFVKKVVDQIEVNLRRIHSLGVKKIAIASLQPLGCLPVVTIGTSFQRCNESVNALIPLHNSLLQEVVAKLNKETRETTFIVLDYYNAFLTVFKNGGAKIGNKSSIVDEIKTPLKPCCEGDCANVDKKGVKKYKLCDDPKSSFFWDDVHPSQEGWRSVYLVLGKPLTKFLTRT